MALYQGRYGPYVSHDGVFATLPKTADPEAFSLEEAIALLAARREISPRRQRKSARAPAPKSHERKAAKPKVAPKRAASTAKQANAKNVGTKKKSTTRPARKPRSGAQRG